VSEAVHSRQLAAILAMDVCGYSRLMGADEDGTLFRLKSHRHALIDPKISEFRGRTVKTTGDGWLVEFRSSVDALRCAIDIQRGMNARNRDEPDDHRMDLRAGVNVGDVIVEGSDIFGDGVNIAARLEGIAHPGGICVTQRVREDVEGRIEAEFEDAGMQMLKNIERPINVHRVIVDGRRGVPLPRTVAIDMALPDKPSIAVMPFTETSNAADHLIDGLTEDLITELSRFRSLFVIAKNTTFTYKGGPPDVRRIAVELGVRYVVEGSVRRSGNRIRVTVALVDGISGIQLWAERYERTLEDIFALQEELTRKIVACVAPEIDAAEHQRAARKRPDNLTAHEIALRAWADWQQAWFRHDSKLRERARLQAREALAIDPRSVRATISLAMCCWQDAFYHTTPDVRACIAEGIGYANRAIDLDRSDHWGYLLRGILLAVAADEERWPDAFESVRHARELNPNDSLGLHAMGWIETLAGDVESGIEHTRQVIRANPRDPWLANVHIVMALASFVKRDYQAGIEWALLASAFPVAYHNIAVCYVGLGDLDRARAAVDKARQLSPDLLEARLQGHSVLRRPEHSKRQVMFLRVAAGLEDPSLADALR
jgi:adenylate cyclase